jgi:hypothetical protein
MHRSGGHGAPDETVVEAIGLAHPYRPPDTSMKLPVV